MSYNKRRLRVTDWWNQHVNIHQVWRTYHLIILGIKTIVLIDHGDLWFLHQGVTISLSHYTRQIDIVVTTTINLPSIVVVDIVQLLLSDAVTIMIGIILHQMNLMTTHKQRWMNHKWHTHHMRIVLMLIDAHHLEYHK